MSEVFEVYDNVPLPEVRRKRSSKYPITTMEVGQMFFMPGRGARGVSAYISRVTKSMDRKFTTRRCCVVFKNGKPVEVAEGTKGAISGTGVWRIE